MSTEATSGGITTASLPALGPNQVWNYDFVHDARANGQKLKCLTVIDEFTRECLALEWFRNRTEARVVTEIHRRHYNDVRPHSSLGCLTPTEFRRRYESIHQGAILK